MWTLLWTCSLSSSPSVSTQVPLPFLFLAYLIVPAERAAHQAPRSLGFFRQEQWSGLPFPSPMHESEK